MTAVELMYKNVINNVIDHMKKQFTKEGSDTSPLNVLKELWERKISESGALDPPKLSNIPPANFFGSPNQYRNTHFRMAPSNNFSSVFNKSKEMASISKQGQTEEDYIPNKMLIPSHSPEAGGSSRLYSSFPKTRGKFEYNNNSFNLQKNQADGAEDDSSEDDDMDFVDVPEIRDNYLPQEEIQPEVKVLYKRFSEETKTSSEDNDMDFTDMPNVKCSPLPKKGIQPEVKTLEKKFQKEDTSSEDENMDFVDVPDIIYTSLPKEEIQWEVKEDANQPSEEDTTSDDVSEDFVDMPDIKGSPLPRKEIQPEVKTLEKNFPKEEDTSSEDENMDFVDVPDIIYTSLPKEEIQVEVKEDENQISEEDTTSDDDSEEFVDVPDTIHTSEPSKEIQAKEVEIEKLYIESDESLSEDESDLLDEDDLGAEKIILEREEPSSEEDTDTLFTSENIIVCQQMDVKHKNNKWKFDFISGIGNIYCKEMVFGKALGKAQW